MRFVSSISKNSNPNEALIEISEGLCKKMDGKKIDLAFAFVSARFDMDWPSFAKDLHQTLGKPTLLGSSCEGVIGENLEIEFSPAMAVIAAHLPDVQIQPFRIVPKDLKVATEETFWLSKTKSHPLDQPSFIIIPDPYTCDVKLLIEKLITNFPKSPIIGGLASGAPPLQENRLILNDHVYQQGAVGVSLSGNIEISTIVSQGCRPIGKSFKITQAQQNVISQLNGKGIVQVLNELFESLSEQEKTLAERSLFIGLAVEENRPYYERGDFLIRNIIAFDPEIGALAIGENNIKIGQVVQFQLRDAKTAHEDLRTLLELHQLMRENKKPQGGLIFSCLGRGKGLYGESHHDTRLIKEITGDYALGGFFCNGEIGPIGGKTFIHGYTSSIGLFMTKK